MPGLCKRNDLMRESWYGRRREERGSFLRKISNGKRIFAADDSAILQMRAGRDQNLPTPRRIGNDSWIVFSRCC